MLSRKASKGAKFAKRYFAPFAALRALREMVT